MNTSDLRQRLAQLPRVKLIDLPTPLHDCPRLAQAVGAKRFLIKRDDLTGLAFGGNKSRKFEFAFADVLAQGCDVVITGAAAQSNHARQAAAAAAKLGLKCYLVNRHDHRSKQGFRAICC
jgi:1-aminocyclopropane-1-carboxylate deaminase/D-cysteine desulfhydrase-like pyridoxal-dependent ACC family enzyme